MTSDRGKWKRLAELEALLAEAEKRHLSDLETIAASCELVVSLGRDLQAAEDRAFGAESRVTCLESLIDDIDASLAEAQEVSLHGARGVVSAARERGEL